MNTIVSVSWEKLPLELLQLADPSVTMIQSYLQTGHCFALMQQEEYLGVMVLAEQRPDQIEIKNIAIAPQHQQKGYGKQLLLHALHYARTQQYRSILIATGNSSIHQLALYQKMGFELHTIRKNFFLEHYPEPLFENGIPCKHQVVLIQEINR